MAKFITILLLIIAALPAHALVVISYSSSNEKHPQMNTSAISRNSNPARAFFDANELCEKRGGLKCHPFAVASSCIAVAANLDLTVEESAIDPDPVDARKKAQLKCQSTAQKKGLDDLCTIRISACDRSSCESPDEFKNCVKMAPSMFPDQNIEFCRSQFC